jgi:hypothetical protein
MENNKNIKGIMMLVVDKYFKSFLCNDGEEPKEQVEDHLVSSIKTIKIPAKIRDILR